MRNTILMFGLRYNVETFDEFHNPQGSFGTVGWGESEEDLWTFIQQQNDNFVQTQLPAGWTAEFTYPNDIVKVYWCFDQPGWRKMLQFTSTDFWMGIAEVGVDPSQPGCILRTFINPVLSPRYTGWEDIEDRFHAAPPTDARRKKK